MKCKTATSISLVTSEEIKVAFRKVDGPDVELLIQAGTNLLAAKAAAELEVELGKPVIAINTAAVWHAYRTNGIMDKIEGWGSLLSEHEGGKGFVAQFLIEYMVHIRFKWQRYFGTEKVTPIILKKFVPHT